MRPEDRDVFVYNQTKETFLAYHVKVAGTFLSRFVGLRRLDSIARGSGLWLQSVKSVHTFGMRFPLDVILLDRDNRVVALEELVRPFRWVQPRTQVRSALELPAHSIFRSCTELGDQMMIEDYQTLSEGAVSQIRPQQARSPQDHGAALCPALPSDKARRSVA